MKKICTVLCMAGIALSFLMSGCGSSAVEDDGLIAPKEIGGRITVMTYGNIAPGWDMGLADDIALFNEAYPDVAVETETADYEEYIPALAEITAAGNAPDVILCIKPQVGAVKQLGALEAISLPPYGYDSAKIVDYLYPILHDNADQLIGLPVKIDPALLCYRTDIAQEYLGTSDPDEISAMLPDWQAYIDLGERLQSQSNGQVFIFDGAVTMLDLIIDSAEMPWMDGEEPLFEENYLGTINLIHQMVDKQIIYDPHFYGRRCTDYPVPEEIQDSMMTGTILFYPANIAMRGYLADSHSGWGYIAPPVLTLNHTEWFAHMSKNTQNPDAAYEFIHYLYGSTEGCMARYEQRGLLPGLASLYADGSLADSTYTANCGIPINLYTQYIETVQAPQANRYDCAYWYIWTHAMAGMMSHDQSDEETAQQMERLTGIWIEQLGLDTE
jgi:multiple sugar transport system substrate-binding protein